MQNAWDVLKEFLPGPINAPGCGWYAKTSLITVMLEEFGDMFDDISISAMLDLRHCRFVFFLWLVCFGYDMWPFRYFYVPCSLGLIQRNGAGNLWVYMLLPSKKIWDTISFKSGKNMFTTISRRKKLLEKDPRNRIVFFPKAGDVGYFSGHDSSKPWSRRWDKLKQPGTVQYKTWSYETRNDQAIHFCEAILSVLFMTCCSKTDPHIQ